MGSALALEDYPNRAGIRLAWQLATNHDSRSPISEIATVLTGEPWRMHYSDAAQVVAKALRTTKQGSGKR